MPSSLYGVFSHIAYFVFIKRNGKLKGITYLSLVSIFHQLKKKSHQMYLGTICLKIHVSHTKSPAFFPQEKLLTQAERRVSQVMFQLSSDFSVFILRWYRKTVNREDSMILNRENSNRIDSPFQNGNP